MVSIVESQFGLAISELNERSLFIYWSWAVFCREQYLSCFLFSIPFTLKQKLYSYATGKYLIEIDQYRQYHLLYCPKIQVNKQKHMAACEYIQKRSHTLGQWTLFAQAYNIQSVAFFFCVYSSSIISCFFFWKEIGSNWQKWPWQLFAVSKT